CARVHSNFDFW
nr:immunoglobulin heavy chain junction region [Macaca mulatta]